MNKRPGREPSGVPGFVVGGRGVLRQVVGNGGHLKRRLGQHAKKLRQLSLHGPQVPFVGRDQRVGRGRMLVGIGLEAGAEAGQILEAKLLGDGQHFSLVLAHFIETDLVNLRSGQVRGGGALDEELVVLCAVGQIVDARLVAAGGNVADFKKPREAQVGRQHFF